MAIMIDTPQRYNHYWNIQSVFTIFYHEKWLNSDVLRDWIVLRLGVDIDYHVASETFVKLSLNLGGDGMTLPDGYIGVDMDIDVDDI